MLSSEKTVVSRRDLRLFGIGLGLLLGMFGLLLLSKGTSGWWGFWVAGPCVVAIYWRGGKGSRLFYVTWMRFGGVVARIVVALMLVGLYLLVLTPISLLARLSRHNFLELELSAERDSYWEDCKTNHSPDSLHRQS